MPTYSDGFPPLFSHEEDIRIFAFKLRNDPCFQSHRRLLETYLQFKDDSAKKQSILGLIAEMYEIKTGCYPATTFEVEQLLLTADLPALQMAKEQEATNAPVDAEAILWIEEETRWFNQMKSQMSDDTNEY